MSDRNVRGNDVCKHSTITPERVIQMSIIILASPYLKQYMTLSLPLLYQIHESA